MKHWPRLLAAGVIASLALGSAACVGSAPVRTGTDADRVAVGYGAQDSRDVTGSISSVTAQQISEIRPGRLEDVLRDLVPGLHVTRQRNGDVSIRIRGTRSLLGSNEPLVVVDGMVLDPPGNIISMLAPSSIARIDVLKDAGSTAAYGSRGANGVIVITTKRGH